MFPSVLGRHLKNKYNRPGIYRWAIFDSADQLIEAYVGESESIHGRLYQYLHPGKTQQTNLRLKAYLDKAAFGGSRIGYEILDFDDFQINGLVLTAKSLGDPHVRKFLEALAIGELRAGGCKVLNLGKDATEKQIERTVDSLSMPTEQKAELLEKFKSIAGVKVAQTH
jgi:hypothetical protein